MSEDDGNSRKGPKEEWIVFFERNHLKMIRHDLHDRTISTFASFRDCLNSHLSTIHFLELDSHVKIEESSFQPPRGPFVLSMPLHLNTKHSSSSIEEETGRVVVKHSTALMRHSRADFPENLFLGSTSPLPLPHPHLIQLLASSDLEDSREQVLVFEYCDGGDLLQYVQHHRALGEPESQVIADQIASALELLHSHGIAHRDLKLENVFLSRKNGTACWKLGDLGFATEFDPQRATLSDQCGSIDYASPEIINRFCYVGPEVDMWSLGVSIYILVTGRMPFTAPSHKRTMEKIKMLDWKWPPEAPYVSASLDQLMKKLFCLPHHRLSIHQLRQHRWISAATPRAPFCDPPDKKSLRELITHSASKILRPFFSSSPPTDSSTSHSRNDLLRHSSPCLV